MKVLVASFRWVTMSHHPNSLHCFGGIWDLLTPWRWVSHSWPWVFLLNYTISFWKEHCPSVMVTPVKFLFQETFKMVNFHMAFSNVPRISYSSSIPSSVLSSTYFSWNFPNPLFLSPSSPPPVLSLKVPLCQMWSFSSFFTSAGAPR